MAGKKKISRRKFLVRGGLGTVGVMAVGTVLFRNPLRRTIMDFAETAPPMYSGSGTEPQLWFELTKDNKVLFHSPKVEMGQGSFTSFAQMIADEMHLRMDQVEVIAAETATGVVDGLSTGGSLSVAGLWQPLRELAATMRMMLIKEAASQSGQEASSLTAEEGYVTAGNQSWSYAEIASKVEEWEVPHTPELKELKSYKHIGKPVPRVDLDAKVFGDPIFGLDAQKEGMVHAAVIRPSVVGAKYKSYTSIGVESMPGFVQVVEGENWVAVLADSYPEALMAEAKLKVEWDIPKRWSEEDLQDMLQVGKGKRMITQKEGSALEDEEEGVVSLSFSSPMGAHAQIEPNGALAYFDDKGLTVVLSTQVPGITRTQLSDAMDMKEEQINVVPTFLGGGFGRRLDTSHAITAAQLAKAVGKPVKYQFSRKEEFQHDTFRPPTYHTVKGKLNAEGYLDSLEHHYASGDVSANSAIALANTATKILGTDIGAMRGGNVMYNGIPNYRAVQWHTTLPFATSWWRSLGLLANTFAIESFVDEMALKAKKNPVEFRAQVLGDEGMHGRLKKVIERAAEVGAYSDTFTNGRAMGFAASTDTNVPSAHVVEVSIEEGQIVVHKVTCVLDCGVAVNPDQVRAQCEGSIIMGMSASLFERMTLRDGELFPTIYGPYRMALMKHAPKEIVVDLVQGADIPLPVGEPPLGPIAAAIGNAIRRLTGERLTDIPLQEDLDKRLAGAS
jgi:isoquinoline 1-oxidoreductase beta subunit